MGGVLCSIMLKICNDKYPFFWLLPVYVEWAFVGGLTFCYAVLPESPWFHARTENREKGTKVLQRLYGSIPGYDVEEEYGVMVRTIQHEQRLLAESHAAPWAQCFSGINRVSTTIPVAICQRLICIVQKRTILLAVVISGGAFGGNSLIYTYST